MPAPATVPEFLELVRKSGLVPENKVEELLGRHRATGTPQKVDQAAAQLVRDGQLTHFQSKQLKLGRYKLFTIRSASSSRPNSRFSSVAGIVSK